MRRSRMKVLALIVVALALAIVAASAYSVTSGGRTSFSFQPYWPTPSTYIPGSDPPTAFLQINYTGSGFGAYSYVITYDSPSGSMVAARGVAIVSPFVPFRAYVDINLTSGVVSASAVVYEGETYQGNPVYTETIDF